MGVRAGWWRAPGVPGTLAALALVSGSLLDVFGPEPYVGLPLLAAAPLVASATLSFRTSVVFAVLAAAASIGLDFDQDRAWLSSLVDLAVVGVVGVLALVVNVLMGRQVSDLARATAVAEAAQRAVLPQPPARAGPLAVASTYTAAQAEARIGGDLFAVQETPFGVRMMIGDVRGKGMQAVGAVSVAIGAFRQEAEHAPDLPDLARRMDEALARNAARESFNHPTEEFTTALLAEVTPDGRTLSVVNRGHPPPYLVSDGSFEPLLPAAPAFPLGMGLSPVSGDGTAHPADSWPLPPGGTVLFVTDGVTEARNRKGVFYDPCRSALVGHHFDEPRDLVDALTEDVDRWTGHTRQDDMAVLAVTRVAETPSRS
ncbi:serine/threonine-protein phosphatase [Streptomyces sp. NBC_00669]|uniref:PP2C family protein-serine/threonine phosphatase n=1 Tax=Streptomyces sp. NBC_00669 TaxID=2976011 RepID=UPI002E373CE6|nr:PP2C family protein-serine/threonine phosphatase [Streptomyces sp. NBC_00669]